MANLKAEFPNGLFGDPALYVWDTGSKRAVLIDCGDLTRFLPRQLLRVSHIFLSHCHMDHFAGFDHFLRLHMGKPKTVVLMGPPETSERVDGKLRGYTWNLVFDQELCFEVHDLDFTARRKKIVRFAASEGFRASGAREEAWDPAQPLTDAGPFRVRAALLDHLTPSLAYAVEQRPSVQVNRSAVEELGFRVGPWIGELKKLYYRGRLDDSIDVEIAGEGTRRITARDLALRLFSSRPRQKIAYVTDGAANEENARKILALVRGSDLLYHETCFLESDRKLADSTRHFTARFVGGLARQAGVKRLVPFHFSKRYISHPGTVLAEVAAEFDGEILFLPSRADSHPPYRPAPLPLREEGPLIEERNP